MRMSQKFWPVGTTFDFALPTPLVINFLKDDWCIEVINRLNGCVQVSLVWFEGKKCMSESIEVLVSGEEGEHCHQIDFPRESSLVFLFFYLPGGETITQDYNRG